MKFACLLLPLVVLPATLTAQAAPAATANSDKTQKSTSKPALDEFGRPLFNPERDKIVLPQIAKALTLLQPADQMQAALFDYLKAKAGREAKVPVYPQNDLLAWLMRRHYQDQSAGASNDPKVLYGVVYEDLLLAQKLLNDKDPEQQRRGLRVTSTSDLRMGSKLNDLYLRAHIYQAFVVPYLAAGYNSASKDLGRAPMLSRACDLMLRNIKNIRQAGAISGIKREEEDLIVMLRLLIDIANTANKSDQGRIVLANVLADQGRYQEAINVLQSIQELTGAKEQIPKLQDKLNDQKAKEAAPK